MLVDNVDFISEISARICYSHAEPVVYEDEHKCTRAVIAFCSNCQIVKDLNFFLQCTGCGTLPDAACIQPKYTIGEVLAHEKACKSLKTKGLNLKGRIVGLGQRLWRFFYV